jgi:ribonuclease BN (tRNA processing enzyme)
MLGTGTPNSDPERSGPAVAIVVGANTYLVDAGAGIVRRAALAAHTDSIPALANPRLKRVFLTHLHSDHTVELPDLMFMPWVLERTAPLEVYGPRGTARMVDLLSQAYSEDVAIRLRGGEPSNKTGYVAIARDIAPGEVYATAT